MTITQQARNAYASTNVRTASPQQLMLLLWDRLVLDLERGLRAQVAQDHAEAHTQLLHAQAILTEFQATLDVEGWTGGHELMALYVYLNKRLVHANVRHDPRATKEALVHCRALRDTWKKAAVLAARGQ